MSDATSSTWVSGVFGDLATVRNGYAFKSLNFSDDGDAAVIRMSNLKLGRIDLTDAKYVSQSIVADLDQFQLVDGDFLFGMSGSLDNYAWVRKADGLCFLNQRVGCLKPEPSADPLFTSYCFLSDLVRHEITGLAAGAAQLNISGSQLEAISVPIPPLSEQKKIATILSSVDEVIEKTRAQIEKLKDLKTGMMQELLTKGIGHTEFKDSPVGRIPVTWAVKSIGQLGEVVTGSTPATSNRENYGGTIPFISPSDMGAHMFIHNSTNTVTQAGLRETREIPEGSVCVVCIGSTIGKTGITTCRSATNQQINSIICKSNHPEFVYYLMTIHSSMVKSEAGTQAVPIINKSSFSALLVQVPPYEEQLKISSAISTVDSSISDVSSKLGALLDIKKALMQDLLTGKVRVNVNQEEAATA